MVLYLSGNQGGRSHKGPAVEISRAHLELEPGGDAWIQIAGVKKEGENLRGACWAEDDGDPDLGYKGLNKLRVCR